jgi:hypothetical protein
MTKSPRKKSPKRQSPRKKSPKRQSPRKKSPRKKSPKRKPPKRQSPKRQSPRKKSPKRKSPKRKSKVRFMFYLPESGKKLDTQDICSICQESFINENGIIDRQVVTCQDYHTYHFDCINQSVSINNKCPLGTENITDLRKTNIDQNNNIYRTNIVIKHIENIRPDVDNSRDSSGYVNGIYYPENEDEEDEDVQENITNDIYYIIDLLLENSINFDIIFYTIINLKNNYNINIILDIMEILYNSVIDCSNDLNWTNRDSFYNRFFILLRYIIFENLTLIQMESSINIWKSNVNEIDISNAILVRQWLDIIF